MRGRRLPAWTAGLCLLALGAAAATADDSQAGLAACSEAVRRNAAEALASCRTVQQQSLAAGQPRTAALALIERAGAGIALARYDEAGADLRQAAGLLGETAGWHDLHRLERQRGILAYRQERLTEAALHFGRALETARAQDDAAAQAQSWNDVGNTYRRIGDYAQALQAFSTSLVLRQQLGQAEQAAAVLNNLGNVQQDLGDYAAAQDWLNRALQAYRTLDAPRQVAHVLESLGLNDAHLGQRGSARTKLAEAWQVFARQDAPRDQLRVATHLARLEADAGDAAAAQSWTARALALSQGLQQPPGLALLLVQARTAAAADAAAARAALRERLRQGANDADTDQVEAWQYLADAAEREHDNATAVADLRGLQAASAARLQRTHNDKIAQWQVRLDVAEVQRRLESLRVENQAQAQRLENARLRLRLLLALAVCAALAVAAWLRLRLQRQRSAAELQQQALRNQNAAYRAAAEALRADRQRLQLLADRSADAMLLLDARGTVLAANRAAAELFGHPSTKSGHPSTGVSGTESGHPSTGLPGHPRTGLSGHPSTGLAGRSLQELAGPAAAAISRAIAACEDGEMQGPPILVQGPAAQPLRAQVGMLDEAESEEPVGWLQLQADSPPAAAAQAPQADEDPGAEPLRRALVALMQASLQAWEQSTRSSRVEFAEKSGIWRVHIDDGRLRMRSMERYLSLAKLPRHPRWREVLRSAYFVLSECPLDAAQRGQLETLVETLRSELTAKALA